MAGAIDSQPYLQLILTGARDNTCREWQEFYTPTQAELPLRVQTCLPSQSEQPGDLSRFSESRREQMEVLAGLRKYASKQPVLLVGKPGSGKSTALKRLCWENAQSCLKAEAQNRKTAPIPVLIELRGCRKDVSVLDLVQKALRSLRLNREAVKDLLLDRRLLVLLDGLNELPSEEAWQDVAAFREEFSDTPMIFTTRELGAGASLGIEQKLEMLPLTEPQMHQFIEKRLPGQADTLLRQIRDRLRELAETPLLLKLLCDGFEYNQRIPKNRGELFRQFAQDYDQIKHRGKITASPGFLDFRDELLQQFAVAMMGGGNKPTEFQLQMDRDRAVRLLEQALMHRVQAPAERARDWLEDLLEHHLLQVASNPREIEFHHQLFQEYYAAEWLLQKIIDPKHPEHPSDAQLQHDYLNYLKWTEPLAMVLGLLDDEEKAVQIVKLAFQVDPMLGARLAGEVKPDFQPQTVGLINDFKIADNPIPLWLKVELWGRTRSDAAISELAKALNESDVDVLRTTKALATIGSEQAVDALIQSLNHSNAFVCQAAALMLGTIGSEQAVNALIQASNGSDSSVGWIAALALGKFSSEQFVHVMSQSLNWLDTDVREGVIYELEKMSSKETAADTLIQALNDSDAFEQAVDVLIQSLNDSNASVRWNVAEALGKIGSEQAVDALIQSLNDSNFYVRRSVVEALGKIQGDVAAQHLHTLVALVPTKVGQEALGAISGIQAQCKFYNYTLTQSLAPPVVHSASPSQPPTSVTMNFNAPVYGPAGNVEGNQIIHPPQQDPSEGK